MSDDLSILLTVEAFDRASGIFDKIGATLDRMGAKIQTASAEANRSAEELQNMQDRAEASATAYSKALEDQVAAQKTLRDETVQLTLAQEDYAAAAASAAGATQAQADAVVAASAKQVTALDAVIAADTELAARARLVEESEAAMASSIDIGAAAMKAGAIAAGAIAIASAVIGVKSVKAAGDFQASMLRMVTSAGESQTKLAGLSQQVLQLSVSTATSTDELTKGLYFVESAGYHAADAITVLKAAAQGARAEGADMAEMANALTTAIKDYGYKTSDATKVTDMMVAAVGEGKMTMQQFATSLSTVLPTAHSAGISFEQVAGSIATMTSQGITAQNATMELNHTIQKLQNPTIQMTQYMAQFGINANDLGSELGTKGLSGVLGELQTALLSHVKNGKVLVDSFNKSKVAVQDLQEMLSQMPPTLKTMSQSLEDGKMTYQQYYTGIKQLSEPMHAQGAQFLSLSGTADGFNQMLKSGQPAALQYTAAMKKMLGDSTSLQTALALTSGGTGALNQSIATVGKAASTAGKDVNGWAEIQDSFNFKMAQMKDAIHATMIAIGTGLLPMVSSIAQHLTQVITPIADWTSKHEKLAAIILVTAGALGTLIAVTLTIVLVISKVKLAFQALGLAMDFLEANPIILILTAIAIVALLVATHWSQTKAILDDVWKWIVSAAKTTADFFVGIWNDVVKLWDEVWGQIGGVVKKWWPVILIPVTGGMSLIVGIVIKYRKQIVDAFEATWAWLVDAWNESGGKLVSQIAHAWDVVSTSVSQEWDHIVSKLKEIWGDLGDLWNATGGKIVSFIAKNWGEISHVIMDQVNAEWSVVKLVWGYIWSFIQNTVGFIVDVVKAAWDVIWAATKVSLDLTWGIIKAAWDLIYAVIKVTLDTIWAVIKVAWDTIIAVFEVTWDTIKFIINTALDIIDGIIKVFVDLFTGKWGKMWSDIKATTMEVVNDVNSFIKSIFGDLSHWLSGVMDTIKNFFINSWHAIYTGISGFVKDIWSGIKSAFSTGMKSLGGIWNDLKKLAADPVNFVIETVYNNGIRALWNEVSGVFGGPRLGAVSAIHFAEGGVVPGVGNKDTVPAMLMPGEFVLSHDMIRSLGGIQAVLRQFGGGNPNNNGSYGIGGIVSGAVSGITSIGSKLEGLAKGGLRSFALTAFDGVNALLGGMPGGGTGLANLMTGGILDMENGLLNMLGIQDANAKNTVSSGSTYGFGNGTWDTGSYSQVALLHPHEAVLPASVASGAQATLTGNGQGNNINIDLRGSSFSNQQQMDQLLQKLEKRIATWTLPAAGIRISGR